MENTKKDKRKEKETPANAIGKDGLNEFFFTKHMDSWNNKQGRIQVNVQADGQMGISFLSSRMFSVGF